MATLVSSQTINSTASEAKLNNSREMVSWIIDSTWKKLQSPFIIGIIAIMLSPWFIRRPYTLVGNLLKWLFRTRNKKNIAVGPLTDVLEYGENEWKGETKQAEQMRMIPEKIFTQGCNWVQQYSFGPEKYTGNNVFGKLRKYLELFKEQWINIYGIKDHQKRTEMCLNLFSEQENEYKMFEAMKFLMLCTVVELHENMRNGEDVPSFCAFFFARDSSSDPLSFMMNHLNYVGDTGGLEQIEMFLLGFTFHLKIRTFRLYKYGTEEFESYYPADCHREWHEVLLLTEDDRHYNVPIIWN
ncbi:inactive ubiquitin thioesterase OTULINL-like isoform X3 [Mustelus asterias]